jgi:hypothetical protein
MTTRRFENNFHSKTQPPSGKPCTLKDHYSGVMRELVGYLDSLAAQDPTGERFAFAKPETIFKHCKTFAGMGYGKRILWYALAEARERRIISDQVVRERWVGSGKKGHKVLRKLKGCIVAPHDCIAHMVGDECHFVGPIRLCGRWLRTGDGGPGSVLYWKGCREHAPALLQQSSGIAQAKGKQMLAAPNAAPVQPQVQPVCSDRALPVQPLCTPCALDDSGQPSDLSEVNPKNGGQALVTVIPGVSRTHPFNPVEPAKPAPPAKPAAAQESKPGGLTTSQPSGACAPFGHDVTKPLGSEVTIGQQFTIKDDMQLLTEISDGEFNPHGYKQTGDIDLLCEYVRMVVEEIAGVPWDNQRTTCAGIMDAVAKRINRAGKQYPKGWLLVLKELQKGGACKAVEPYRPPRNPNWVGYQNHDGPPNEWDAKPYASSDWNMCRDWICRNEAGRAEERYTVKAADGIWDKA